MFYFRVAGLPFRVDTADRERELAGLMTNYGPFADKQPAGEISLFTLATCADITFTEAEPYGVYPYDVADDKAVLYIYSDRYILTINSSCDGREYLLDCPFKGDVEFENCQFRTNLLSDRTFPPRHIIDHFLVFAFSLAALGHGALVIHSSAIVNDGRTVLFLGESGTGKSTHTRLWLENIPDSRLLNDDGPVVRIVDGRARAYGSPWSGKTPCYRNEVYPLAAFIRLKQAPFNKIEKPGALAAFGALLPSCLPTLQKRESELDAMCATLSAILSAVPVYTLDCLPNADAARLSHDSVFARV